MSWWFYGGFTPNYGQNNSPYYSGWNYPSASQNTQTPWGRNDYARRQYNAYAGAGSPLDAEARYSPMNFGANADYAARFAKIGDLNGNGHIDRFEFQRMSGVNTSRLRPDQYREAFDVNRDGRVDYTEAGRGLIAAETSDNGYANGGISARERDAMNRRLSTYAGRNSIHREISAANNPFATPGGCSYYR